MVCYENMSNTSKTKVCSSDTRTSDKKVTHLYPRNVKILVILIHLQHLISLDAGWNQHELPLPSSTYDWNFNRFMDEYNKLYATLNHLDEVKLFCGDMSIQRGEDASKHEVLVQVRI